MAMLVYITIVYDTWSYAEIYAPTLGKSFVKKYLHKTPQIVTKTTLKKIARLFV